MSVNVMYWLVKQFVPKIISPFQGGLTTSAMYVATSSGIHWFLPFHRWIIHGNSFDFSNFMIQNKFKNNKIIEKAIISANVTAPHGLVLVEKIMISSQNDVITTATSVDISNGKKTRCYYWKVEQKTINNWPWKLSPCFTDNVSNGCLEGMHTKTNITLSITFYFSIFISANDDSWVILLDLVTICLTNKTVIAGMYRNWCSTHASNLMENCCYLLHLHDLIRRNSKRWSLH